MHPARHSPASSRKHVMKKNLLLIAALAVMLAGCVVVPERPMYVHVPRVVVY
jgi:starvation-inducible outer membrane lipoprotein